MAKNDGLHGCHRCHVELPIQDFMESKWRFWKLRCPNGCHDTCQICGKELPIERRYEHCDWCESCGYPSWHVGEQSFWEKVKIVFQAIIVIGIGALIHWILNGFRFP